MNVQPTPIPRIGLVSDFPSTIPATPCRIVAFMRHPAQSLILQPGILMGIITINS